LLIILQKMRAGFGGRRGADGNGLGGGVVGSCSHLAVGSCYMLSSSIEIAFQQYEYTLQEIDVTD